MAKAIAWISCDPGATGYWCLICPDDEQVVFIANTEPPCAILDDLIGAYEYRNIQMLMLEDVHSLGNMSAKSNFVFGYNVGVVNTLAQLSKIPTDKVAPKVWQKAVGIAAKRWPKGTANHIRSKYLKEAVADKCRQLYPYAAEKLVTARGRLIDGKSDALMIAHYARLTYPY